MHNARERKAIALVVNSVTLCATCYFCGVGWFDVFEGKCCIKNYPFGYQIFADVQRRPNRIRIHKNSSMVISNPFRNILLIEIHMLRENPSKLDHTNVNPSLYLYNLLKMIYTVIITQHPANIEHFRIFLRRAGQRRPYVAPSATD